MTQAEDLCNSPAASSLLKYACAEKVRYTYKCQRIRDFLRQQNYPPRTSCVTKRELIDWLFDELQRRAGIAC